MNLTKIAVHRPVTTFMGILVVVVLGFLSLVNINLDMMPNIDMPIIAVMTTYDGAGSNEIETLITEPLEGALGTVPGVDTITSQSSNGSSVITIQFVDGTNVDTANLDVRDRIAMIEDYLPANASEPTVMKFDISSMTGSIIMDVTSSTRDLESLQTLVDDSIVPRIKTVAGVADVSTTGGLEEEILITLQEDKLRGYGLSESTISSLLMAENLTLPAGTIKQGNKNMPIRVDGEFTSIEEIENLPMITDSGQIVYLRDVATVEQKFAEYSSLSYTNGTPSITLTISKQSTANTVEVSQALNKELVTVNEDYPDIALNMLYDPADYIQNSISGVVDSAVVGVILATIILFIFLKDPKVTLVVALAMPLSIIATFILMYYTGITLNMLSLGGLMLGVGMLVDNSIVVIESVFRRMEEGESSINAAINGAKEVSISIVSSTLTTIVVFLPITFAGGITADMFNPLSFTIIFSLLSSLIVALSFVPMMSALLFKDGLHIGENVLARTFDKGYDKFANGYKKLLTSSLNHRKTTYVILTVFTAVTLVSLNFIGMTLIPEMDEGMISVSISYPVGTTFDTGLEIATEVVDKIDDIEEIELINTSVSNGNTASATMYVILPDKNLRDRSAAEITDDIESRVADIAGCEISATASSTSTGGMGESAVSINVSGSDMDQLEEIANDFVTIASDIPGVGIPETSIGTQTEQANITIDRNKAYAYGLNSNSITSILSTAIDGTQATTFKFNGSEYDVVLRQDANSIEYLNDLQNILIPTPYGISIPLYEIADIELVKNPATISRENQQRYVTVTIPVVSSDMGTVSTEFEALVADYTMPDGYLWKFSGTSEQMTEIFGSLGLALVAAVLLVYMVMAANFESLIYPFIVMFSIPVAITGAFFGLFITGQMISMMSFVGLIMLAGIVINNAIVLIDYTNILIHEREMMVYDALVLAGRTRLRPILMSTLTTVLGLVPMAISNDSGSEMLNGLAITVIYGLIFSTVVTLVLIPTIYLTVNTIQEKRRNKKNAKREKKELKELTEEAI